MIEFMRGIRTPLNTRVQVDDADRSKWKMKHQATGVAEYWHPTGVGGLDRQRPSGVGRPGVRINPLDLPAERMKAT
jgi:hypothetical protein